MKWTLVILITVIPELIFSQTITKKPVEILQMGGSDNFVRVSRSVIETDTSYYFSYQDHRYPSLLPLVTEVLTKDQLIDLNKSIQAAKKAGLDDMVSGATFTISKVKVGFGSIQYDFTGKGIMYLNDKRLRQLEEMIQKEISPK